MDEARHERVKDPEDPRRCQAIAGQGQCPYARLEHSEYCEMHGGIRGQEKEAKAENRMYRLGKWRAAVSKFQDHDQLKSLREEIGIMRMMIDERMQSCTDAHELLMVSGPLGDLVMKVEKLVLSCNKIESHLSGVLDKTQALQLGQEIVEILGKYLDTVADKDALIKKLKSEIDDPNVIDAAINALADCKSKDDILEGISNDIILTIDRLGKTA